MLNRSFDIFMILEEAYKKAGIFEYLKGSEFISDYGSRCFVVDLVVAPTDKILSRSYLIIYLKFKELFKEKKIKPPFAIHHFTIYVIVKNEFENIEYYPIKDFTQKFGLDLC